jgi:hypothetical protein
MVVDTLAARLLRVRVLLIAEGIVVLFWWPLSHWLYPVAYHTLLGFEAGTYPDPMVKVIGTCGLLVALLLFLGARDPLRNRDLVVGVMAFSLLLAATYAYLIAKGDFPPRELVNIAFSLLTFLLLLLAYPWGSAKAR